MSEYLFTSESVTEGHPDKLCDQVSDAVLDACIQADKTSRVACETLTKTGFVMVAGEITTAAQLDFPRDRARRGQGHRLLGFRRMGFDWKTCGVMVAVEQQSPDIAQGVDGHGVYTPHEQGAGDQGMMFGYACDETPELMPMPITLAHKLSKRLADVRKKGTVDFFRPDGKSQVTIRYDGEHRVLGVDTVVVSTQHSADVSHKKLKEAVMEEVIKPVVPQRLLSRKTKYFINPDRPLRGRRPHGRLGPHRPQDHRRHLRRHGPARRRRLLRQGSVEGRSLGLLLRALHRQERGRGQAGAPLRGAAGLCHRRGASRCRSWCRPSAPGALPDEQLSKLVDEYFDARPGALIQELDLRRPIFRKTAAYGHFGRADKDFTWERTNHAAALQAAAADFAARPGRKLAAVR